MSGEQDRTKTSRQGTQAGGLRPRQGRGIRVLWVSAVALSIALATGILTTGTQAHGTAGAAVAARSSGWEAFTHAVSSMATKTSSKTAIETDLMQFKSAATVKAFEDAPGMPSCTAPQPPAATHPPGESYGIPFLAAITNGELLAGYDEWTANNNKWNTGKAHIHLYPWQSKIFDITGWVTGLIQLPNLSAQIPPQDVVFCDQGGTVACLGANPPPDCVRISSQFAPQKGATTPPPADTNVPGSGNPCTPDPNGHPGCPCSSTPYCLPFYLTLTPVGTSTLTVTGVAPDGSLELSVKTSAVTTATLNSFSCQNDATTVTLSTQIPASLPASAPVAPMAPNTDYRGLQTKPEVLTGPLDSSTSTVVGNDFSVPAFIVNQPTSACTISLTTLLNTYAGGWGLGYGGGNGFGQGLYYQHGGKGAIVTPPGWGQFSATTTVVTLGLPVGPPPGFNF